MKRFLPYFFYPSVFILTQLPSHNYVMVPFRDFSLRKVKKSRFPPEGDTMRPKGNRSSSLLSPAAFDSGALFPYGEKTFPFMNKSRLRSSRRWRSPPPERGINKRKENKISFKRKSISFLNSACLPILQSKNIFLTFRKRLFFRVKNHSGSVSNNQRTFFFLFRSIAPIFRRKRIKVFSPQGNSVAVGGGVTNHNYVLVRQLKLPTFQRKGSPSLCSRPGSEVAKGTGQTAYYPGATPEKKENPFIYPPFRGGGGTPSPIPFREPTFIHKRKSLFPVGEKRSSRNVKLSNDTLINKNSFFLDQKASKISLIPIEYSLQTYHRSNQDTCLVHKPTVVEGDWVETGDLLADCSASIGGELSLGHNILIAYMPWEGFNYEDAILISERLVFDDVYTSVHIEKYETDIRETKDGKEEITKAIPGVDEKEIQHLNNLGIVKIGTPIEEGDILVGKRRPINPQDQSGQEKLNNRTQQKPPSRYKDISLRAPKGIKAKVINISFFSKHSFYTAAPPVQRTRYRDPSFYKIGKIKSERTSGQSSSLSKNKKSIQGINTITRASSYQRSLPPPLPYEKGLLRFPPSHTGAGEITGHIPPYIHNVVMVGGKNIYQSYIRRVTKSSGGPLLPFFSSSTCSEEKKVSRSSLREPEGKRKQVSDPRSLCILSEKVREVAKVNYSAFAPVPFREPTFNKKRNQNEVMVTASRPQLHSKKERGPGLFGREVERCFNFFLKQKEKNTISLGGRGATPPLIRGVRNTKTEYSLIENNFYEHSLDLFIRKKVGNRNKSTGIMLVKQNNPFYPYGVGGGCNGSFSTKMWPIPFQRLYQSYIKWVREKRKEKELSFLGNFNRSWYVDEVTTHLGRNSRNKYYKQHNLLKYQTQKILKLQGVYSSFNINQRTTGITSHPAATLFPYGEKTFRWRSPPPERGVNKRNIFLQKKVRNIISIPLKAKKIQQQMSRKESLIVKVAHGPFIHKRKLGGVTPPPDRGVVISASQGSKKKTRRIYSRALPSESLIPEHSSDFSKKRRQYRDQKINILLSPARSTTPLSGGGRTPPTKRTIKQPITRVQEECDRKEKKLHRSLMRNGKGRGAVPKHSESQNVLPSPIQPSPQVGQGSKQEGKGRGAEGKKRKSLVTISQKKKKSGNTPGQKPSSPPISKIEIYLAEKRRIQVGDKMAGRHGNKGIVSQIIPREDMPYLPDGTPVDMVLNPLGVPSRMNVGQIYECLLGLAGKYLGTNFRILPFDEIYGAEASRSFVFSKLYEARTKTGNEWLFDPNFPGKTRLFDGRTGDCFDQPVTVGQSYMLKLVHLVDDKMHCLTSDHDVLTTEGWLPIANIKPHHKVATLEKKNRLVYHHPTDIQHYSNYKGQLYHIKNLNTDLLVTVEHRMYVQNSQIHGSVFEGYELIPVKYLVSQPKNYLNKAIWKKPDYQLFLPITSGPLRWISPSASFASTVHWEKTRSLVPFRLHSSLLGYLNVGQVKQPTVSPKGLLCSLKRRNQNGVLIRVPEHSSDFSKKRNAMRIKQGQGSLSLPLKEKGGIIDAKVQQILSVPHDSVTRSLLGRVADGVQKMTQLIRNYLYIYRWRYAPPRKGGKEKPAVNLPSWVWELSAIQVRKLLHAMMLLEYKSQINKKLKPLYQRLGLKLPTDLPFLPAAAVRVGVAQPLPFRKQRPRTGHPAPSLKRVAVPCIFDAQHSSDFSKKSKAFPRSVSISDASPTGKGAGHDLTTAPWLRCIYFIPFIYPPLGGGRTPPLAALLFPCGEKTFIDKRKSLFPAGEKRSSRKEVRNYVRPFSCYCTRSSFRFPLGNRLLYIKGIRWVRGAAERKYKGFSSNLFSTFFTFKYAQLPSLLNSITQKSNSRGRGTATVTLQTLNYYTFSEKLADDIMRLALHAGWCAQIKRCQTFTPLSGRDLTPPPAASHSGALFSCGEKTFIPCISDAEHSSDFSKKRNKRKLNIYHIAVDTNNKGKLPSVPFHLRSALTEPTPSVDLSPKAEPLYKEEIISYDGAIYCLTVPNEIFFVRRNGRPVWTGNSRSTGPYALITQQPLRGRSKQGGQRLGEMEVWALQGYGAAFILLEMLTIKSDDKSGRDQLLSNILRNKKITIGTPESFKMLVSQLQALCLNIGLFS